MGLLEFTPIEVSKLLNTTNKTVIKRCAKLTANGFLVPNIVKERIRSYSLSEFAKANAEKIAQKLPLGKDIKKIRNERHWVSILNENLLIQVILVLKV